MHSRGAHPWREWWGGGGGEGRGGSGSKLEKRYKGVAMERAISTAESETEVNSDVTADADGALKGEPQDLG